MKHTADLAVIGGGPGGYVAALRAARGGLKVILIEEDNLGGTCLNRGCIPTKTLIHAAELIRLASVAPLYGVRLGGGVDLDINKLQEYKKQVVETLRNGVSFLLEKSGVKVIRGRGVLAAPGRIQVIAPEGEHRVEVAKIIIAAGSSPGKPAVECEGEVAILSSEEVLELATIPRRAFIIGGGAIGVEFAGILNTFGSRVVLAEAMPALLPAEDRELTTLLAEIMRRDGITVYTGALVEKIVADGSGGGTVCLRLGDKAIQEKADLILAAVGRKPNSGGLGLDKSGVKTEKGWIVTDDNGLTSAPGVYAVGDITGRGMLAHTAMEAAVRAVDHLLRKERPNLNPPVPRCVFYRVELAAVGATEEQLKERQIPYRIGRFPFNANGRALTMGETAGLVKVLAGVDTGELLGVHILGPHASTMISEAGLGMTLEATLEEFALAVHPHPTVSEALQEACLTALGLPLHSP